MPSWVQCKKTGKFIPKEEYYGPRVEVDFPMVQGDFKSFISPITKEEISDRGQLRRHLAKHGVAPASEYSPEYMAKRTKRRFDKLTGNTKEDKKQRVEAIKQALERGNT